MKRKYTWLLLLAVTAACSQPDGQYSRLQAGDSTNLVSSHEALEKVIWDYYVSIEEDVRKDLGVSEAEVIERVQALIDDGYVKAPAILVVTRDGPKWKTVNYPAYKEYMTSNAVISRRFHGTQQDILDTLSTDSIQSSLLNALKADSLH